MPQPLDLSIARNHAAQAGKLSRLGSIVSQTLNVLLFDGAADESISGRSYREGVLGGDPKWLSRAKAIDRLVFWEKDHCRYSHMSDRAFATLILTHPLEGE